MRQREEQSDIEETCEDLCYLPDTRHSRIFELKYCPDTKGFSNPPYDKTANVLWKEMKKKGMEEERLKEVKRCLKLGCVRADWQEEREELDEQIKKSSTMRDKNYWVCMKRLKNIEEERNHVQ